MFEQAFKNIDDILHKDAGCGSELDYVEQTSWVLFLKYLEDLERDKQTAAQLAGKTYQPIIAEPYKWHVWAVPKTKDGKIDHHQALSGDDLKEFVDHKLFPYLKKFKADATNPNTIEYKIGEIFSELKNKIHSGYNLREVLNLIDGLRFRSKEEKHEMSHLYEDKIKNMGNAGRNGGEYYTPRPLIKIIVKVVAPEIGNKIFDGAVGSAGFLAEAFEYLKASKNLTTKDAETLQKSTFYGKEKKGLAYIIGTMNMILHGVEAPTSFIPTHSPKTYPTFRKKTATTSCWRIRRLAVRKEPKCSRTSRLKRGRRLSCSCNTSSRYSRRAVRQASSSRIPFFPTPIMLR